MFKQDSGLAAVLLELSKYAKRFSFMVENGSRTRRGWISGKIDIPVGNGKEGGESTFCK